MVAVAGLWGIWHIVSGGSLALLWRYLDRSPRSATRGSDGR
jgi:BASS family bile acid:Na+ symporter